MNSDKSSELSLPGSSRTADPGAVLDRGLQSLPAAYAYGPIGLSLALTGLALLVLFAPVLEQTVPGSGVVLSTGRPDRVSAEVHGYIETLYVRTGQEVAAGDPLLLFTYLSKPGAGQAGNSPESRAAQLQTQITDLENEYRSIFREKEVRARQDELDLDSLRRDISYSETQEQIVTTEFENTKRLFERQLISLGEYNNTKSNLERTRTELIKLKARAELLEGIAANSAEDLRKAQADYGAARARLQKELESLSSGLAPDGAGDGAAENQAVIKARQAGIVTYLPNQAEGAFVAAGALLYEILAGESGFAVEMAIDSSRLKLVRIGQKLRGRVANAAGARGLISGRVLSVPAAPLSPEASYLLVQGVLDQDHFTSRGRKYSLQPELTVAAEVITGRESLISRLLNR